MGDEARKTREERSRELHNMLTPIGGIHEILTGYQWIVEGRGETMVNGTLIQDMILTILDAEYPDQAS
jgi:hypothetical protein